MNDSTPVYSTSTGKAPKTALARNIKVVNNEPVKKITKPRVKKHTPTIRKNSPVRHIKVDKRVWKVALRLAHRDLTRIEVRNSTEVVVHHPGRNWKVR